MTTSGTDETLEATPSAQTADSQGGATAELHELGAGDSIGRYQIVGVLGSGGMGRVYRARDPDLNRELAIKVLRRAPGSGSGGLEHRLLREAQAMARLKHANLATVYDVGAVRGEVFIAFEFIDGKTLAQWMREPGRTTKEKLNALVAAGRGLEAAHSAGVIHRDFKPDNVLVAHDGEVKVVDFGLARGVDAADAAGAAATPSRNDALATDLTMTGSLLGTPAYMAPEQHKGLASDARADQFGFAVSAWEALYGERPFKGKNLETLATAICGGAITPPPAETDVPPGVEAALRRAMSVDPAKRFADIDELLAKLTTDPATPPPPPSEIVPRMRRRWLALGAILSIIVGATGLYIAGRDGGLKGGKSTSAAKKPELVVDAAPPVDAPQVDGDPLATTRGDLDKSIIREEIHKKIDLVTSCYESALLEDAKLGGGTVAIQFVIGGDGKVISTKITEDDFQGRGDVAGCVASKSFGWKFPAPQGGGIVAVTYPFSFHPAVEE